MLEQPRLHGGRHIHRRSRGLRRIARVSDVRRRTIAGAARPAIRFRGQQASPAIVFGADAGSRLASRCWPSSQGLADRPAAAANASPGLTVSLPGEFRRRAYVPGRVQDSSVVSPPACRLGPSAALGPERRPVSQCNSGRERPRPSGGTRPARGRADGSDRTRPAGVAPAAAQAGYGRGAGTRRRRLVPTLDDVFLSLTGRSLREDVEVAA